MSISMSESAFAISYDTPEILANPNPQNPEASDHFGESVSVLGNNVLVSSNFGAYLYNLNDGTIQKKFDNLGAPLMLTDRFVVGNNNQGMIDIYDVSTGNLLKTINNVGIDDPIFVSGNNILVGDPGAGITHLFDTNGNMLQTFKNPVNSTEPTSFGNSLSMSGNTVIIGAPLTNVNQNSSAGAIYLFDKTSGKLVKSILDPEPKVGANFGKSIASYGNSVLVGASGADSAYMFDITTGNWLKTFQNPDNNFKRGIFGYSVALDQNYVLIGAPGCFMGWTQDSCEISGNVFLFDSTSGNLLKTFFNPKKSTDLTTGGYVHLFGIPVSMSNGIIVVGAPGEGTYSNGDAFVFFPISQPHYPTLDVPTSDYVVQPTAAGTVIVPYDVQGRDSKGNSLAVSCNPSSGSIFLKGTTTVTCSATDGGDNTGTASFKVIVGTPSITSVQNTSTNSTQTSSIANSKLPSWVRNDFKLYGQDQLSENELLNALRYLIQIGIIKVS